MKKQITLFLSLCLAFGMVGCGNTSSNSDIEPSGSSSQNDSNLSTSTSTENTAVNIVLDTSDMFTERDKEIGYDESSATKITLNNETVNITEEGIYILSGEIKDGQIIVEVSDTEKVQLVLDGVSITSSSSAPIYVKSADKVFVTLAQDSENTLFVIGEYAKDSENNVDGAVFSKNDITFNGDGNLTVNATYGHGIVGKDDVVFTSGTYTITAEKHGVSANDSVRVADGTFYITSGKDGVQVENEDAEKGFLYVAAGKLIINSDGDAVSTTGAMQIEDGNFSITTGEGAESVSLKSDTMGGGMRLGMEQQTTTEKDNVSQKGLKTDSLLTINGGNFTIDTVDDGLHAAGNIQITTGDFTIKSGDDGIHSDIAVIIENGNFSIPYCYEAIEGLSVTINGGEYDIISSDDGLNAAGGTDNSGFGGRGGGDPFSTTEGAFITINGGTITVVSDGDSIDSNGALTINSGTLNLTCNGNGNTAIDASGTYINNGGNITTNDGSESGNHMGMGGGRPGGGGKRPDKGQRPEGMTLPESMENGQRPSGQLKLPEQ